ncbi:MAG: glycosyltransferase family 9 protein [Ignavibacteria bacterium]
MSPKNDSGGKRIEPKNLLIVRTDRIGDVVLSLPLAGIVKKHYPQCKITFLLRNYTKSLVENHPYIDEVIILHESNQKISLFSNIMVTAAKKFDSCVIVYPTFIAALIIFLSGIKNRIGTGYRWYSFLFNRKVYEHRKHAEKHELEYNINLLQYFGIYEKTDYASINFDIKTNDQSLHKVNNLLIAHEIKTGVPLIIVHPGSGGSSINFPPEKFKELIGLVDSNLNTQILVTGSENEKDMCGRLIINEKIKNFAGLLDLSELIALISRCSIFISNSTGPIHIAAALGKYTIGFYPNLLACSAKRWGPYTEKKAIFTPDKTCSDCRREQCSSEDCMKTIKATDVFVQIEKIYKFITNIGELNVQNI